MKESTQWGQFLTHYAKFPTSRPLPGLYILPEKPFDHDLLAGFLCGA